MTTLVYVESEVSLAFQFINFNTQAQAERFVNSINNGENTLRARLHNYA